MLTFMMTSSKGHIFRVTGPLCGKFTGHRGVPLTKASDTEHLNNWANKCEAGDFRRHRAHYDVTVMYPRTQIIPAFVIRYPTWIWHLARLTTAAFYYRNWYQYLGHCCLINDMGNSPQPEGKARGLWWASQVVNETTMNEIEVSISILSWLN